jgi:hypothetical protein
LAVLAKDQTEPENAISLFIRYQRRIAVENGGATMCRGNRESAATQGGNRLLVAGNLDNLCWKSGD